MSSIEIRPHHVLCIGFYEGKGYSTEFTENMTAVVNALEAENAEVTLTVGADAVCAKCPQNSGGVCLSHEKSGRYDEAVLRICGLEAGCTEKWYTFRELICRKIVSANRLEEVCGDCCWYHICSEK